jgi:predicted short-subunit dehydrogenase-like oxidoreductase (DUF2520 family)
VDTENGAWAPPELIQVIGRGRAGSAIAGRLGELGMTVLGGRAADPQADLVILAVPDAVIAEVGRATASGPWVAHVSGATPLTALEPHMRRFAVHPLQTLTRSRGPEQLDGAWAAITADSAAGWAGARWLADALGLHAFELSDEDRPLYHAGAAVASNFLVTLYRVAARLLAQSGAPPEALEPLMRRVIENDFELTGPIARGDWSTVEAHLTALRERAPDLEPLYRALADATRATIEHEH